jgi:hypothetical protein
MGGIRILFDSLGDNISAEVVRSCDKIFELRSGCYRFDWTYQICVNSFKRSCSLNLWVLVGFIPRWEFCYLTFFPGFTTWFDIEYWAFWEAFQGIEGNMSVHFMKFTEFGFFTTALILLASGFLFYLFNLV